MNVLVRNVLCFSAAAGVALAVTAVIAVSTANTAEPAAPTVCGDDAESRQQLWLADRLRHCEQQAVEPAVGKIHTAPLTASYLRHFPEHQRTDEIEAEARG